MMMVMAMMVVVVVMVMVVVLELIATAAHMPFFFAQPLENVTLVLEARYLLVQLVILGLDELELVFELVEELGLCGQLVLALQVL